MKFGHHTLFFVSALSTLCMAQSSRDLEFKNRKGNSTRVERAPRGYALVIGIGKYKNLNGNDLRYAESDALAFHRELISKEGGAFATEDVRLLIGSEATLANIKAGLESWLPKVARAEDRVVVFFAGHGVVAGGTGYFATWNIDLNDIPGTAYPMGAVTGILNSKVAARWKVLFADACHSGKINSETTNERVAASITKDLDSTAFLSFAATIGREQSFEDPSLGSGFGIFTYFLIQAMKGQADSDPCDGWVTARELVEFVRNEVTQHARSRGVSQTPHVGSDYDPAMILSMAKSCGDPNNKRTGAVVVEANLDETQIWIDGDLFGAASPGKPLRVPGLADGPHGVCGRKRGYADDCKRILVPPGRDTGVTVRLRYQQAPNKAARELLEKGWRLLYSQRSTVNPINIVPVSREQSVSDLKRAREAFHKALDEDGSCVQAAYELGIVNQLLGDESASIAGFRRAIQLDPGHGPARVHYAGVLIENGDTDEAAQHLIEALRFDPEDEEAKTMLARTFLDKGVWGECIAAADGALQRNPLNEMAHLWRADCLRQLAAGEKKVERLPESIEGYRFFLGATNFSTSFLQWFAYHFIGFGLGRHEHADRLASFQSLRRSSYLGLCIAERLVGHLRLAEESCNRALETGKADARAYFALGLVQLESFNRNGTCYAARSARTSFGDVLRVNAALEEAAHARHYVEELDAVLRKDRIRGFAGCNDHDPPARSIRSKGNRL